MASLQNIIYIKFNAILYNFYTKSLISSVDFVLIAHINLGKPYFKCLIEALAR